MNKKALIMVMFLIVNISIIYAIENDWKIIANSSNIYHINTFYLKSGVQNRNYNTYIEINIPVIQTLKGEIKNTVILRLYLYENYFNHISSLPDNIDVILFLKRHFNPWGPQYGNEFNYYIADNIKDSIIIYDNDYFNYLTNEITFQNRIITEKLYEQFEINTRINGRVRNLVRRITNRSSQVNCFIELENNGNNGVPYIILCLYDFRELPIKNISLRNYSPNAFEGVRHYGPYLVVDALAAILNQITGESFGFIYNGDDTTDEERKEAINGWYIYLYYLMKK
jgi:hypothetical protein